MNTICANQNQQNNIELLAAQRQLYSKGKDIFHIRCVLVLVFLIIGFITVTDEKIKSYFALASILYLFLDMLWLEKLEEKYKTTAAKIQELFDTRVLDLDWNTLLVEEKPDNEEICEAYESYKKSNSDLSNLQNWYATEICSTDLKTGRVLCQRCNIVWDSRQKRGFVKWLIGYLFLQTVVSIIIAMQLDLTISNYVLSVLLPLLPSYNLIIKQIDCHLKSAKTLDSLKGEADRLIALSLDEGTLDMKYLSRLLQNEIYNHRKSCAFIPDWIYYRLRAKGENEMYYNVRAKLEELNINRS